jgi:hypothetical protein
MQTQFQKLMMVKLKAMGVHLLLSGSLFLLSLYFILFEWYPGPTFAIDGGWQGVRIMIMVDLVLGPLLTLVVFNPWKARPRLILDLAVIIIAQLAAFGWGVYAVHLKHPMALAYHDKALYSIEANVLKSQGATPFDLAQLSSNRPPAVFVEQADAAPGLMGALQEDAPSPVGPIFGPEEYSRYRPLRDHLQVLRAQQDTWLAQLNNSPASKAELDAVVATHGPVENLIFTKVIATYGDMIVALDSQAHVVASFPSSFTEPKDP